MGTEIEDGFHELLEDKTGKDLMINTSGKGEDESNFQSGVVDSLHCHAINKKDTGREMGLSQKKEELLMLILENKEFDTHPSREDELELKLKMSQERLG